jgi:hypothetical protein
MKSSRLATIFICVVATSGLSLMGYSVLQFHSLTHYPFLVLLVVSAIASRLKLKLPGINGNMSVNLPFILIAAAQLSLFEGMLVALVSSAIQTLPKRGSQLSSVKLLFNVNTMALASGTCALLWHRNSLAGHTWSGSLPLVASCAAFFLVNTLPVATIISLTEGAGLVRTWSSISQLSFPYYLACTGLMSIVSAISRQVSWTMPVAILPVMVLMYVSYRLYFSRAANAGVSGDQQFMAAAAN